MLGVMVSEREQDIAAEFFELFKTPWEPARADRRYRAVLCTNQAAVLPEADVTILYGSSPQPRDRDAGVKVESVPGVIAARVAGMPIPLYTQAATFAPGLGTVIDWQGRRLDYRHDFGERVCWRVGYDLFAEVEHLLVHGQSAEWAATPTLDLHIDLLRRMLRVAGVPFVEVRPAPLGHSFACCLTHDVDFFGIRRHRLDATTVGFLARASVGSLIDLIRGRRTLREAGCNWMAVLSLPLVLLGLRADFWDPVRQYLTADGVRPSTYFVVPSKARPGVAPDGHVYQARAVKYEAGEVAGDLRTAVDRGHEVAVHGLDAWRDSSAARAESASVAAASGVPPSGIRMHWLYFDDRSAGRLDDAGFEYDSTWGFNDTVGFRAGTAQAFRWSGCRQLMELPLAIMDTALFFPGRLDLTRQDGMQRCIPILDHAARAGGTVVVNWHDRSLVPERLWDTAYQELLGELDRRAPWYATASDTVGWFNWRRSITFAAHEGRLSVQAPVCPAHLPGGVVRAHRAGGITDYPLQSSELLTLGA